MAYFVLGIITGVVITLISFYLGGKIRDMYLRD